MHAGTMLISTSKDEIGRDLVKVSEEALEAGIRACGPGKPFRGIAKAIHEVVKDRGYVVCPAFTGHGIGSAFHRPPWIWHDRERCSFVRAYWIVRLTRVLQ